MGTALCLYWEKFEVLVTSSLGDVASLLSLSEVSTITMYSCDLHNTDCAYIEDSVQPKLYSQSKNIIHIQNQNLLVDCLDENKCKLSPVQRQNRDRPWNYFFKVMNQSVTRSKCKQTPRGEGACLREHRGCWIQHENIMPSVFRFLARRVSQYYVRCWPVGARMGMRVHSAATSTRLDTEPVHFSNRTTATRLLPVK